MTYEDMVREVDTLDGRANRLDTVNRARFLEQAKDEGFRLAYCALMQVLDPKPRFYVYDAKKVEIFIGGVKLTQSDDAEVSIGEDMKNAAKRGKSRKLLSAIIDLIFTWKRDHA